MKEETGEQIPHISTCPSKFVRDLMFLFLTEEEASRALKTLRSSKAPLAKKRQVMRAMTGDYRKKMEEERAKQFKLIQSGEYNVTQRVKVVYLT